MEFYPQFYDGYSVFGFLAKDSDILVRLEPKYISCHKRRFNRITNLSRQKLNFSNLPKPPELQKLSEVPTLDMIKKVVSHGDKS